MLFDLRTPTIPDNRAVAQQSHILLAGGWPAQNDDAVQLNYRAAR